MAGNWDLTQDADRMVALSNYFGDSDNVCVTWIEPYAGVLGRWYAPVQRETWLVNHVKDMLLRSGIHGGTLRTHYPWPDGDDSNDSHAPVYEAQYYVFGDRVPQS